MQGGIIPYLEEGDSNGSPTETTRPICPVPCVRLALVDHLRYHRTYGVILLLVLIVLLVVGIGWAGRITTTPPPPMTPTPIAMVGEMAT
jgi:hypothetical protein